ncbi:MAG TPA: hypothetical protein VJ755_03635, partial [Gemmatimonadales bacterium]|nr:hypothetical protein [Gemmatimonadales bacterium]
RAPAVAALVAAIALQRAYGFYAEAASIGTGPGIATFNAAEVYPVLQPGDRLAAEQNPVPVALEARATRVGTVRTGRSWAGRCLGGRRALRPSVG